MEMFTKGGKTSSPRVDTADSNPRPAVKRFEQECFPVSSICHAGTPFKSDRIRESKRFLKYLRQNRMNGKRCINRQRILWKYRKQDQIATKKGIIVAGRPIPGLSGTNPVFL